MIKMSDEMIFQERLAEIKELVKILYSEGLEIESINEQVLFEVSLIEDQKEKNSSLTQLEQKLFYYLINQHNSSYISLSESDFYFNSSQGQTVLQKISNHLSNSPKSSELQNFETFEALFHQKVKKIFETLSIPCFSETFHIENSFSDSIDLKVIKNLLSIEIPFITEDILLKLFDINLIIFLREYRKVIIQKNFFFQELRTDRKLKIVVTRAYSERFEGTARVYRDRVFSFGNCGQSEYNDRSDSMILIGTSKFCNIILPDDINSRLKLISFVIYLDEEQVFIQDLRDEGFSYIKLNYLDEDLMEVPVNERMYQVNEGTIVNLCRKYDFFIKNISFFEVGEKIESSLVIQWINGPFQGKENLIKTFQKNSEKSLKNNFSLGRGGNGINPDIYCLSCMPEVARDHLRFYYQDENWYIEDRNSKNFSFVGIKNLENFEEKRPSEPVSMFLTKFEKDKNRKGAGQASFLIEKTYMFLLLSQK
jgi:hypothetical protein